MNKKNWNHDKLRKLLISVPSVTKEIREENLTKGSEDKNLDFNVERFVQSCLNFPPAPDLQYLYRNKAEAFLEEGREKEAVQLFLILQALTVKHQILIQKGKLLNVTVAESKRGTVKSDRNIQEILEENELQRSILNFNTDGCADEIIQSLPSEWTVLQICSYKSPQISRFKQSKRDVAARVGNPSLCLIRLSNDGSDPVVRLVPGSDSDVPYLMELQNILKEQSLILKEPCTDRHKYWNLREELNARMQTLVKSLEDSWLGSAKSLLLGKLKSQKAQNILVEVLKEVCEILNESPEDKMFRKLEILLSSSCFLTQKDIFAELVSIFPHAEEEKVYSASALAHSYAKTRLCFRTEVRQPVIFILDPEVQCLPWESLPLMRTCKQAASRIPSLELLSCLWRVHRTSSSSVVNCGLSTQSVFYMIDPDSNLPKTQERLDRVMKGFRDWEGLTGQPPEPGQLANMLGVKDAFIYSGHGSGNKYISEEEVEKLKIRVTPLLLGCSSGQLSRHGRNLDPLGVVQSYMIGTAPAVAGFLWPVTDVDVDKWTIEFLEYWLTGREADLLQAVADQRKVFSHFVNSAALIVYGLPVTVQAKKK